MSHLIPIVHNRKPFATADGSVSFYNTRYQQAYRSISAGAYTESLHKFVRAGLAVPLVSTQDVRLMDVCFGLGYNLAVTLDELPEELPHRLHIVSLELDATLYRLVLDFAPFWPRKGYDRLRTLIRTGRWNNVSMEIITGDASKTMKLLSGTFHTVYFDPFSKKKNPEMWTIEVFSEIARLLDKQGRMVTYASSKGVRSDMQTAGLVTTDTPRLPDGFQPGTVAVTQ